MDTIWTADVGRYINGLICKTQEKTLESHRNGWTGSRERVRFGDDMQSIGTNVCNDHFFLDLLSGNAISNVSY